MCKWDLRGSLTIVVTKYIQSAISIVICSNSFIKKEFETFNEVNEGSKAYEIIYHWMRARERKRVSGGERNGRERDSNREKKYRNPIAICTTSPLFRFTLCSIWICVQFWFEIPNFNNLLCNSIFLLLCYTVCLPNPKGAFHSSISIMTFGLVNLSIAAASKIWPRVLHYFHSFAIDTEILKIEKERERENEWHRGIERMSVRFISCACSHYG